MAKPVKSHIAALLLTITSVLALAVVTPVFADEEGKNASTVFVKSVVSYATGSSAHVKNLYSRIQEARELHAQGKKFDSLASKITADSIGTYNALNFFKIALENAALNLKADDPEAMALLRSFIEGYDTYKGILDLSAEVFGALYPFKAEQTQSLDLVFPDKIASALLSSEAQHLHEKGGAAFDTTYLISDAGDGKKRLSLHPRLMSSHRIAALTTFPSKQLVENALEFEAHKTNFAKLALNNSHLYSDEKVQTELPDDIDPVLRNIDSHAKAFADESMVRKWTSPHDFTAIAKAVLLNRDPAYPEVLAASFRLLSDYALPWQSEQGRLDLFGGTPEKLAEKTLILEQAQLATAIHTVVVTMPGYLTEMSRASLKVFLQEAITLSIANITLEMLFHGMFDEAAISAMPEDSVVLSSVVMELAREAFKVEVLTDSLVEEFQKTINVSREKAISFARYKKAQDIVAGAEYLDAIQETIERVSEQSKDYVPTDLIPAKPDPGIVLLAMTQSSSKAPIWFTQILKSLGSKTKDLNSPTQVRALYDALTVLPVELREEVNALRNDASKSAVIALSRFHADLLKNTHYRWMSAEEKMKRVMKASTNQPVKNMMGSLLSILELSDRVHAPSLRAMVEDMFEVLCGGNRNEGRVRAAAKNIALGDLKVGLDFFAEQINDAEKYLSDNDMLIQTFFSKDENTRYAFLQRQLGKKAVFMGYIKAKLQDLEARLPILFAKVPLWKKGRDLTGNDEPVAFGDLVIGLRKAVHGLSLDKTLTSNALKFLETDILKRGHVLDASDLSVPIDGLAASVNPRQVALYATMGSSPRLDYWKVFMTKVYDRVFDNDTPEPPVADFFWSEEFKVRDVLPAYFDSTSSLKSKALKIMVSSLLGAYLQSSATAASDETKVLLAPGTPNTKQLLKTPVYGMLLEQTGSAIGGGLKVMHEKAIWRTSLAEDVKKVTGRVHTVTHYIFMSSFLLKFSPAGHAFLGHAMALSSFFDLSADIMMYADYWQSYSAMAPFSFSNAMGGGLVTYDEADLMKDEISMMTKVLLNRIAMDLWFFRDVLHGDYMRIKFWSFNRRIESSLAKSKIPRHRFDRDYMTLLQHYQRAGVRIGTGPAEYRKLHKEEIKKLKGPANDGDQTAKAHVKSLNELRKSLDKFEKKYPALVKILVGKKKGKSGFKDENDFQQEQKALKKQRQLRGEE